MDEIIFRIALENAIKFNGKTNTKAILGRVLSEKQELKKNIQEAEKIISEVVDYVNGLDLEQQKKEFSKFKVVVKEHVKKEREVPELPNVKGKVVMRFAPNPNGPLSIGHCRPALWNWFFAEKYKGEFILRLDDTDPKNKIPMKEAYKWIEEDLEWLGVKINKIVRQSSRLKIYYGYAKKLIEKNGAYICTCDSEKWKNLTEKKIACPCRSLSVKENLERWEKMFTKYKEEKAVMRVKTDIQHNNPALRDWPAFRIVNKPNHPFEKKSKVWPLLNFASAIDDHEFNVTHILRGVDLMISDDRQKFLYQYFGWKYPETLYNGKFLVSGIKSTSEAGRMIKAKKLTGWDDPRLGTIRTFRRRGFTNETIRRFIKEAGFGRNDLNVSIDKLAAFNKDIIDKKTYRYFFVQNPVKIKIQNAPKLNLELDLHPETKKGGRKFQTTDVFYISKEKLSDGIYRLMDCLNFVKKGTKYTFDSQSMDDFRAKKGNVLLHWLPASKGLVNIEMINEEGQKIKGYGEKGLKAIKMGDAVQFVRIGFAKLEKKSGNKLQFIFCHK